MRAGEERVEVHIIQRSRGECRRAGPGLKDWVSERKAENPLVG